MNIFYLLSLVTFSIVLGISQIILKNAIVTANSVSPSFFWVPLNLLRTPIFYVAILLYLAMGLGWTWLLTKVPVSKAYPFVVLSFVVVAVIENGFVLSSENLNLFLGILLILGGLILVSR